MTSINISLPESMKAFVEQQVAKEGYNSASEYLQQLISQDQKRLDQEHLEELLIEGLESGELIEVTDEWWEQKTVNYTSNCWNFFQQYQQEQSIMLPNHQVANR